MEVVEEPAGTEGDGIVASLRSELSRSTSSSTSASDGEISGDWQYEEEDVICRFCHGPGDSDNPLRYPCACRGTIKFVHQDCLLVWLDLRKISHCEVCKQAISFVPLYAENTPARLSPREFVIGTALIAFRVLLAFQLLAYCCFLFMLVPCTTLCLWELSFGRSFGDARRVLLSYLSVSNFIEGSFLGFGLCSGIAILSLVAMCFRFTFVPLRLLRRIGQELERIDDNRNGFSFILVSLASLASRLALVVLSINMVFIGCLVFVPFCIGRIVSLHLSGSAAPLVTLENAYTSVEPLSSGTDGQNISGQFSGLVTEMFHTGKIALETRLSAQLSANQINNEMDGVFELSDGNTILIGYIAILSLILFRLAVLYLPHYARSRPSTWRQIHNAIGTKAYAIFSALWTFVALLWQISTAVKRHYLTILKISLILGIKVGIFPLMCGLWLNVCTPRIFGGTFSLQVEFFVNLPFVYLVLHWIVGIFYLLYVFLHVDLLQVVLRNRVLFFLPNVANTKLLIHEWRKSAMHQHFCHILLFLAIHGSLMVLLVFLPIKLAAYCEPPIFPLFLSTSRSESFAANLVDKLVFHFGLPCLARLFYPSTTMKALIHTWLTVVGSVLGLNEFLLAKPEGLGIQANGIVEPVRQHRPHYPVLLVLAIVEGSIVQTCALADADVAEDNSDDKKDHYQFSFRILLLLVLALITALLFNSIIIASLFLLGRPISEFISRFPLTDGSNLDDIDALLIGSCIIEAVVIGARYAVEHVQTRRIGTLLKQLRKWGGIVLKSSAPLSILIFVIPVLSGLLFDLTVIVPIRVPLDESPVLVLLLEDLLIGWVLLTIWSVLILADTMELFVDRSWRLNLEKVLSDEFFNLSALWVLGEIVFPIMEKLLIALCVPHVFARCIFPMFGYPLSVNSAVYRYAWLSWLAFGFLLFCVKMICALMIKLHDSIRDEHYKIGQTLKNFGEDGKEVKQC